MHAVPSSNAGQYSKVACPHDTRCVKGVPKENPSDRSFGSEVFEN